MTDCRQLRFGNHRALSQPEFWRAFLVMFNHYLVWELPAYGSYPPGRKPPQEVIDAVMLLGCWRDICCEEDWADERNWVF